MAEEHDQTATDGLAQAARNTPIAVLRQYLKDLSFESPNAPEILGRIEDVPHGSVQVEVRARPIENDVFEVSLLLTAQARHGDQVVYITQIDYAGQFQLGPVPQEAREPLIMIEAPRLLFPYARAILATTTRDGGFAPLLLNPIDFAALYRDQRRAMAQEQPSAAGQIA